MTFSSILLAASTTDAPAPLWKWLVPFVVVIVLAAVCVPWARRARGRGGLSQAAPIIVFAIVIGALCLWMFTT